MQRTSRAHARARRRLRAVIPGDCGVYNPLNKIAVFHPGLCGSIGHIVTIADEWVRIGLQHPDTSIIGQPDIETAIIPQPQSAVRHAAGLGDSLAHRFRERTRQDVPNSLAFAVSLIPLGELSGDPFFRAGLSFIENHLRYGEDLQAVVVADDAHVELTPVDELFGYGTLAEPLMDERHPLHQGLLVLHHR